MTPSPADADERTPMTPSPADVARLIRALQAIAHGHANPKGIAGGALSRIGR